MPLSEYRHLVYRIDMSAHLLPDISFLLSYRSDRGARCGIQLPECRGYLLQTMNGIWPSKSQTLMPIGNTLAWILLKRLVAVAYTGLNPLCFAFEHEMRAFRWLGEIGIYSRGLRVKQFRPPRVPRPQGAATIAAETPFCRTRCGLTRFRIGNLGAVFANVLLAVDLQRFIRRADIDGITARACCFTADRTVAKVEWIAVVGLNTESNVTTVAGPL
jgi:hypothetical protein